MSKKILVSIIILFLLAAASIAGYTVYKYPFRIGYAPEQPINFSHKIHAGDNQIPCQFCHLYARRSIVAGIPSVQTCYNCHKLVAGTKNPEEVKKVLGYWDRKQPIPWIKVFDLPDFVHFSHKRHVAKGKTCQECHGPVETMDRVERITFFNMGWCVNCHRKNGADDDCWVCHK